MAPLLKGLKSKSSSHEQQAYPFSVPVIHSLQTLNFQHSVCFFVGENGSGKSTLLEGLAAKLNLPTIGAEPIASDPSLAAARTLAETLQLQWQNRIVRQGFFLRSEDFFGFIHRVGQMQLEFRQEEQSLRQELSDAGSSDYGVRLATGSMRSNLNAMIQAYGENPDGLSHGESYLQLFSSRLHANRIYLMDEPEAALSPMRQLALLQLMMQADEQGSQFIISTHSPILMAYPEAQILLFENGKISEARYEELEHVQFTRQFLNNPAPFLHHLKSPHS